MEKITITMDRHMAMYEAIAMLFVEKMDLEVEEAALLAGEILDTVCEAGQLEFKPTEAELDKAANSVVEMLVEGLLKTVVGAQPLPLSKRY